MRRRRTSRWDTPEDANRDAAAPLILTASLAPDIQDRFEALRRAHFPPARNLVPAHATLFHALPPDGADAVAGALAPFGTATFPVAVTGVRLLGRGVAFSLESDALAVRRDAVARWFRERLTPQDRQRFKPHVTVQNKVSPEAARSLHAALTAGFAPIETAAAAIHLWRYLGGPWEPIWAVALT